MGKHVPVLFQSQISRSKKWIILKVTDNRKKVLKKVHFQLFEAFEI